MKSKSDTTNRVDSQLLAKIASTSTEIEIKDNNGIITRLFRNNSRYIFAYVEMNSNDCLQKVVPSVRKEVQKHTKALWLLNEKGLYILVSVQDIHQIKDINTVKVDKTGFHAVILQAVHFVDKNGNQKLIQSQWFGRTFGKSLSDI